MDTVQLSIVHLEPCLGELQHVQYLEPIHCSATVRTVLNDKQNLTDAAIQLNLPIISVEFWCNIPLSGMETSDWHAIPMRLVHTEILKREIRYYDNYQSQFQRLVVEQRYSACIIPVRSGTYEITARAAWKPTPIWSPNSHCHYSSEFCRTVNTVLLVHQRSDTTLNRLSKDILYYMISMCSPSPKIKDYHWIWAGKYQANARIHIVDNNLDERMIPRSRKSVNRFVSWFGESVVTSNVISNTNNNTAASDSLQIPVRPAHETSDLVSAAYASSMLAALFYESLQHFISNEEVLTQKCNYIRCKLMQVNWLRRKGNCVRLLTFFCGSSQGAVQIYSSSTKCLSEGIEVVDSGLESSQEDTFSFFISFVRSSISSNCRATMSTKTSGCLVALLELLVHLSAVIPSKCISPRMPFDLVEAMDNSESPSERMCLYQLLKQWTVRSDDGGAQIYSKVLEAVCVALFLHSNGTYNEGDVRDPAALETLLHFTMEAFLPKKDSSLSLEELAKATGKSMNGKSPVIYVIQTVVRVFFTMRSENGAELELLATFLVEASNRQPDVALVALKELCRSWDRVGGCTKIWLLYTLSKLMDLVEIDSLEIVSSPSKSKVVQSVLRRILESIRSPNVAVARQALHVYDQTHRVLSMIPTIDLDPIGNAMWTNTEEYWDPGFRNASLSMAQKYFPNSPTSQQVGQCAEGLNEPPPVYSLRQMDRSID